MNRSVIPALALLLGACTVGPDYERPPSDIPQNWQEELVRPADVDTWWTYFGDAQLVGYIEESLAHNNTLKVAAANVAAAAAALNLARADYLPGVNAGVEAARGAGDDTQYRGGLFLSYELDLFGRIRRANEAALAELEADVAVHDGVRAAIAAAVANAWFESLALNRQIASLERLHQTRLDNLELQQLRHESGLIPAYDVEQSRAETAVVAGRLPVLRAARQRTLTALAVLRGISPRQMLDEWAANRTDAISVAIVLPSAPPVPMGLPSELLERRPDIRAAEQRLVAANARIGEAQAAFFPRLSLTGFAGGISNTFSELFDTGATGWQAVAAQPLLDIARVNANVDSVRARHEAAMALYARTVQTAFKETLDALVDVHAAREVMLTQQVRLDALENAFAAAEERYRAGAIGYLELLDVERQLRDVELERVDSQLALLQATVSLYRALGGGWRESGTVASRN